MTEFVLIDVHDGGVGNEQDTTGFGHTGKDTGYICGFIMRILVILPRIPYPPRDGGAIVMFETVRELTKAGHDVDVFVLNTSRHRQPPDVVADICSRVVSVDIDTEITAPGALKNLFMPRRVSSDGGAIPLSYWLERFVSDAALGRLFDLLDERGPYDVIQCESLFTAWYGLAIRRAGRSWSDTPVVLRAHNVEHRIMERLAGERRLSVMERRYRRHLAERTKRFEMEVVRALSGVAAISPDDAAWFRAVAPGTAVDVVMPGIMMPSDDILDAIAVEPCTLCILSSMEWAPNVEGAIWFIERVMPSIVERLPGAVLHVAGRNPGTGILALHDGRHVIVHGEIDDALVFRRSKAVSVVPLFSGSGVRIKIIESMAAGVPLVTTSVGAEGLPVVNGEQVVIADDERAFADACVDLLVNGERARAMGERGRAFARSGFSWDRRVNDLTDLYRAVIPPAGD